MTDDEGLKNASAWMEAALIHGYNELAKTATTLGEKVYFRMARDAALASAQERGVMIKMAAVDGPVVFELGSSPPFIIFHERDIEGMREAVAKWDAARSSSPPSSGAAGAGEACGHPCMFCRGEPGGSCARALGHADFYEGERGGLICACAKHRSPTSASTVAPAEPATTPNLPPRDGHWYAWDGTEWTRQSSPEGPRVPTVSP